MTAAETNRFTKETLTILSRRAGLRCSNPTCDAVTAGPHSDDVRVVTLGEGAHIRGAEPGSARYDPMMNPIERRSVVNGIWLCANCHSLVDRDERRYSVEVLYDWKRRHEAKIEQVIGKPWTERVVSEYTMRAFASEHPAAQQLLLDKPEAWEYMLTAELLRSRLGEIRRSYDDLKHGVVYRPSRRLDWEQLRLWMRERTDDLSYLIHMLNTTATDDLSASWGPPGQPGDALEILRAVDNVASACRGLFEWEVAVAFARFPEEADHVRQHMTMWTEHFLVETQRIHQELARMLDGTKTGVHTISLVFTSPPGIDAVAAEFVKVMRRHGGTK